MTNQQVGAWIRERRTTQKLSVAHLAHEAGIARQTWYDLEKGNHPPTDETQRGVARAFGLRVDWFDRLVSNDTAVEVDRDDVNPSSGLNHDQTLLTTEAVHSIELLDIRVAALEAALIEVRARLDATDGPSQTAGF